MGDMSDPDYVTNTPEDAALYEQRRAADQWDGYLYSACGEHVTAEDLRGEAL